MLYMKELPDGAKKAERDAATSEVQTNLTAMALTDEQRASIQVRVDKHPDAPNVTVVIGEMDDEDTDDDGNPVTRVNLDPVVKS